MLKADPFAVRHTKKKPMKLCCVTALSHSYDVCHGNDNLRLLKPAENKMYRMHRLLHIFLYLQLIQWALYQ